ncbi:hypothetical protein A3C98_05355 [Candidatus Roizmanbacteria bacterium RIFCSPHIGHO2_02_FULL_37_15]|uniref:Polymerase nucleotidyl transferase domain-containing protein n=1 Tax=Candidatus Roizmanbacteria bacterium RIFCSPLOWO2_01_FULL_37_16 TaxID=1802058 RepID=A0A1F7ILB7_9BACT|nr:MAG: hypothetical protein A2859_04010 [Candidatus Roizmanbacteria bacterium RIFCSPHIGHO2_01_FULL_37_16b]OGK22356.1 MAG: hypothetical protein A3C98_05355 [Candidatus Roizmanbacteria bacterium RIFCSPHIGHO2_02_FULL_37_15]OGK44174.1 MAG: hypothetical protein A3B40_04860 [Candidatus Roizmanbacteria bacterium RIFCSPLOWO2_01_FULL_37_16]
MLSETLPDSFCRIDANGKWFFSHNKAYFTFFSFTCQLEKKVRELGAMEQFNNLTIEQLVKDVLRYFFFFNYPLTLEEIYTFLKKKTSKRRIMSILEKMEKESLITRQNTSVRSKKLEVGSKYSNFISSNFQSFDFAQDRPPTSNALPRYTLTQYKKTNEAMNQWNNRQKISINKLNSWRFKLYTKLLSLFPQIKLVGLSGSVAMLNAGEDHDIDLFIITGKDRLWTGRFIALFLAQLLSIRRKRDSATQFLSHESLTRYQTVPGPLESEKIAFASSPNQLTINNQQFRDTVCLNLFFDANNLKVPKLKQTDYVAHEVLQMKPLRQKNGIYLRFIDANKWVFDIFPNARSVSSIKYQVSRKKILNTKYLILNTLADKIEQLLKSLQLHFIKKHQTTEIVTDTQLWFHPDDFGKKIKNMLKY